MLKQPRAGRFDVSFQQSSIQRSDSQILFGSFPLPRFSFVSDRK
jgi:hypothetical protein